MTEQYILILSKLRLLEQQNVRDVQLLNNFNLFLIYINAGQRQGTDKIWAADGNRTHDFTYTSWMLNHWATGTHMACEVTILGYDTLQLTVSHSQLNNINPSSPSCIVKFSQLEPILFIEQVWENFSFNLQWFALFDQFSFSHYQKSYFVCVM